MPVPVDGCIAGNRQHCLPYEKQSAAHPKAGVNALMWWQVKALTLWQCQWNAAPREGPAYHLALLVTGGFVYGCDHTSVTGNGPRMYRSRENAASVLPESAAWLKTTSCF